MSEEGSMESAKNVFICLLGFKIALHSERGGTKEGLSAARSIKLPKVEDSLLRGAKRVAYSSASLEPSVPPQSVRFASG